MYNTSANYKTFIKKPSRNFESKVVIGTRTFTNTDIIQIVPEVVQPQDGFSIGNTVSQSVDITLKNDGGVYASVGVANVTIGLNINGAYEDIPIGIFNIYEVTKTDYTVKITAYDNMIKFETGYYSSLGDTPTLQQVVDELKNITGIDYDTTNWTIPNYTVTKLTGCTCREVLGMVASICGGNAYITRQGKFTVKIPSEVGCTVTADNYINTGYTLEDSTYTIGMVTCQNVDSASTTSSTSYDGTDTNTSISVGSLSSNTMELTFKNIWVTESILNDIYNKLNGFSYIGYKLKWQGDLSLDAGDIITVIDKNNVTRKAFVYANKLTYTGGLTAETSAKGETKNSNSFSASNSTTKDVARISVKLLLAEKAILTKANIVDLEANNARIDNLDASIATIQTALINYASIDQLNATNANIATLNTSVANINTALVNKANVADLNATNANISTLNSTVSNIQTLLNGNLTSANIQSLVLTSSKVTVDNGFIKSAMIESLDATKITTGSLNTNKVSVTSTDGSLIIAGATQQFKDSNGYVRLQLGQDTGGNFSFILRASDGTTTLIDGTGVHANAIADKLIKTNMIADSAIGSQQINYSSFITGVNADTNTSYIKASKVSIDLTGQTLETSFNNITTTVNGLATTTSNNSTSITAIQGQITTLISNTTITTDGNTVQLKDAYNGTVSTINSMQTTIGQHSSTLDSQSGEISSISSQVATIQTTLSGVQVDISNTQSNLNTTNANLTSLQVSLSGIDTRVQSTENTLTNLMVGGRNYILASNFQEDIYEDYWNLTNLYSLEAYAYNNYAYNALVCANTTNTWSEIGQEIDSMQSNAPYTFSAMCNGEMYIQITQVIYNPDTNSNDYVVSELYVDTLDYSKETITFTTSDNVRYGYINIATPRNSTTKIALLKLEQGTLATDWTPAPEDLDQSIAIVQSNMLQTVNDAVSTITQTTDAISLNVSNLQSSVSTINSTLGTKADATTVTNISNTVSSLQTSISGINASITTLNSTTTSNTNALNTVDSRIATAKSDAISAASTDATTKSNNAITSATANSKSYTDSQITTVNSSISTLQSSVSILQSQIALKVEQSNIDTAISTVNGRIDSTNTTVSNLQSQITIQAGQISSKVEASTFNSTINSIGGTNLLDNTGFNSANGYFYRWSTNSATTNQVSESTATSKYAIKIMPSVSSNGGIYQNYNFVSKFITGQTYIVSFYAKADSVLTMTSCRENSNSAVSFNLTTSWQKFSYTFTQSSTTSGAITFYAQSQINFYLHSIKVEKGTTATDWTYSQGDSVGTIITQSPAEVMTAFNNITSYFQVNSSGATFGDTTSGDYTTIGSGGIKHHIGSSSFEYLYVVYSLDVTFSMNYHNWGVGNYSSIVYDNYVLNYDSTLMTMLNGRTPKFAFCLSYATVTVPVTGSTNTCWLGVITSPANIGSSAVTIKAQQWQDDSNNNIINGGTANVKILIIA